MSAPFCSVSRLARRCLASRRGARRPALLLPGERTFRSHSPTEAAAKFDRGGHLSQSFAAAVVGAGDTRSNGVESKGAPPPHFTSGSSVVLFRSARL